MVFFTVEQWKRPQDGAPAQWMAVIKLDSCQSLSQAIEALEKRGQPGLYRVVQPQRCIWAGMAGGKLRLHRSHAGSRESLARLAETCEREGGRRPVEKARQERAQAKTSRAKK